MKEKNYKPLISVLIPLYNVERYVKKCLESVFGNTMADDCEFILVDDGSQDKTLEEVHAVCAAFPWLQDRIHISKNNENKGVAYTRNALLEKADGLYIAFIDSDDYVESDYLAAMFKKARENDADVVGCWRIEEYHDSRKKHRDCFSTSAEDNIRLLLQGSLFSGLHCRLFKRQCIVEYNLHFLQTQNMGEDGLFCAQFFFYAKSANLMPAYLYHYIHYNENSLCSINNIGAYHQRTKNADATISFLVSHNYAFPDDIACFKARINVYASISKEREIRDIFGLYYKDAIPFMIRAAKTFLAKVYVFFFIRNCRIICGFLLAIKYGGNYER